jgi:formylmethanofuran dehydrogenase subunit E
MTPKDIEQLLRRSAGRHDHLCPRQVLGVRMGLVGLDALQTIFPIGREDGLVLVETDGCFVDGIEVSTGVTIGHRTLRVNDLGKIAATFVNARTGEAIRLSPQPDCRARALLYAAGARSRYAAQLAGYRLMSDAELFRFERVQLQPTLSTLISRPDVRQTCDICGEEIINEREVLAGAEILCRTCAGLGYYATQPDRLPAAVEASVQAAQ